MQELLNSVLGRHRPTGNLKAMKVKPDQPAVPYSRIMRKSAWKEARIEARIEAIQNTRRQDRYENQNSPGASAVEFFFT